MLSRAKITVFLLPTQNLQLRIPLRASTWRLWGPALESSLGTNPRTHRGDGHRQHPPRGATFSRFQPGSPRASISLQELPPGQVWLTWAPFHPHPRRAERTRARYVHGRRSRHLLGQETRLLLQKLPRAQGKGRVNFAAEMEAQPGIAKRQKQKMFSRTDGVCYKLRSGAILIFSSTKKEVQTSGGGGKNTTAGCYPLNP